MNTCVRDTLRACLILVLPLSASADPPLAHLMTRQLASTASAAKCENSATGYSCQYVSASKARDNRGQNETANVYVAEDGVDYSTGNVTFSRSVSCPVPLASLATSRNRATLNAYLDTASLECFSDGMRCDWGVDDPPVCEPYNFTGVVAVSGTWEKPIATSSGQTSRKNANSATGEELNFQCNEAGGSLMQAGGFSVGDEFTSFDGRTSAYDFSTDLYFLYGEFLHQSCNFTDQIVEGKGKGPSEGPFPFSAGWGPTQGPLRSVNRATAARL